MWMSIVENICACGSQMTHFASIQDHKKALTSLRCVEDAFLSVRVRNTSKGGIFNASLASRHMSQVRVSHSLFFNDH